jgi:hypothetical protein
VPDIPVLLRGRASVGDTAAIVAAKTLAEVPRGVILAVPPTMHNCSWVGALVLNLYLNHLVNSNCDGVRR